ncbi:MAG: DUF732 domain-containing protein [Mycobacterium sp.]|uniref:DUF732 domain-containing protein n=1 Tax=Mycobacterium sp. TaxID=1785 RepID=UPI001EC75212|nr:DUF732 domain-containing protein [Mycobacterium sp.]MBW0018601.1 DUF732 domain-containing protein [Mycobacterium sp.]
MVTRLLAVLAAASIGLLAATPSAHADTSDDRFLASLKSQGISDHMSPTHAIEAGHLVCTKLDNGVSPSDVASDVLNSSSMPAYHSGYFVGAAIDAYCPQHRTDVPAT